MLSVQLSSQDLAKIDAAAQAFPYNGSRSKYARSLLFESDQIQLEADRQKQQLIEEHQQQLDQQNRAHAVELDRLEADNQQQIDQLHDQVASLQQALADSQAQLQQQQQQADKVEAAHIQLQVTHGMSAIDHKQQVTQLERDLATARQNEQRWQTECTKLKKSQREQQQDQKTSHTIEAFTRLIAQVIPSPKQAGRS